MPKEITAYHGTNSDNVNSIIEYGFKESADKNHWFGTGVYFFTDGISETPSEDAAKWAIASAWDNYKKELTYTEYSVVKAVIIKNNNKLLDLTSSDGIKSFNFARRLFLEKIREASKKLKNGPLNDGDVLNELRNLMDIEIVFANVYIKYTDERIFQLRSSIPNATIIVIQKPQKNIKDNSVEEFYRGEIPYEF